MPIQTLLVIEIKARPFRAVARPAHSRKDYLPLLLPHSILFGLAVPKVLERTDNPQGQGGLAAGVGKKEITW